MVFNDSPGHTSQWRHVPCDITMNGSGRTEGNDAVVAKLKGLGKKSNIFLVLYISVEVRGAHSVNSHTEFGRDKPRI